MKPAVEFVGLRMITWVHHGLGKSFQESDDQKAGKMDCFCFGVQKFIMFIRKPPRLGPEKDGTSGYHPK